MNSFDDDEVFKVAAKILRASPTLVRLQKRLITAQEKLRDASNEETWSAYLVVEEISNEIRGEEIRVLLSTTGRKTSRVA